MVKSTPSPSFDPFDIKPFDNSVLNPPLAPPLMKGGVLQNLVFTSRDDLNNLVFDQIEISDNVGGLNSNDLNFEYL